MQIKLSELVQQIVNRLHTNIIFYDHKGHRTTYNVLKHIRPIIKEVLREQLTVNVQDDGIEEEDDEG